MLAIKLRAELGADLVLLGFGEADAGVVALHCLLDGLHAQVGHGAVGAALVTAQAEEVEVLLGPRDAQAAATPSAGDGALEVVVVDALLLPCQVVGLQYLLDALEEAVRDEGLMAPFVLGAVEEHFADVVPVTQDSRDVGGGQRPRHLGAVWQGLKSLLGQGFGDGADGPLPRGVGLEGPPDERCPLRVDNDDGDFAALDALPGVEVADRGPAWRPAKFRLLGHALQGFGGEVAGVELGNARHDGVQQLPSGGLVDVFLDADQRRTHGLQLEHDVGVVPSVAGEAVHLVQDDVIDVALLLDEDQHLLELTPVSGLGRLTPVNELRNHLSVQALSFVLTGVALGGERAAVWVIVTLHLFGSRHPKVDHGSLAAFRLGYGEVHWREGWQRGPGRCGVHRALRWRYSSATVLWTCAAKRSTSVGA
nr:hypothetical protein [Pseudofrankia saprophytica]